MNEIECIRKCVSVKGVTYTELARKCGYNNTNNITALLCKTKNGLRFDIVSKILSNLGYEIVVRNKYGLDEYIIE